MRVVLAEDLALLRDGLIRLLEAYGFEVVAAVDNAPALRPALPSTDRDVAVVDVRLPPTFTDEGLRAAIAARAARPGLPGAGAVASTSSSSTPASCSPSGEGGVGYLLKDRVSDVERVRRRASAGSPPAAP